MAGFTVLDLLNDTSRAAQQFENFIDTVLDYEDIRITSYNKYSMTELEDMATGIELAGGLQEPLILAKIEDEYWLISGHRRISGIGILVEEGKERFRKVPCRYREMTEREFRMHLLIGNTFNRKLTDYDIMMQAEEWRQILTEEIKEEKQKAKEEKRLIPNCGRVRDYVAKIMQQATGKIATLEAINRNGTEEVKEQFRNGSIGITAAHQLSRMPEEEQRELAEKIDSGELRSEEIKEIAEQKKREKEEIEKKEEMQQPSAAKMQQEYQEEHLENVSESDTFTLMGKDHAATDREKENTQDYCTKEEEKEDARRLHTLRMLEKYHTYMSGEEAEILERILEDCRRRKREYASD